VKRTPDEVAPTQRDRQRAETRERVFAAALDEFRRAGVALAQIDRIARTAGVVRGTFYFHFPTKEHVLLELQQRQEAAIVDGLARLRRRAPSLRTALLRLVEGLLEAERTLGDRALVREMLSMYVREPVDSAVVDQHPLVREITFHLERAAASGELRRDLDPAQLALVFLTSSFGFLVSARPLGERRTSLEALVDVFLRGCRA